MSVFDMLLLMCAVGCGLTAGVFLAFSTCVMHALGKLPTEHGMAAMKTINIVILNPLFLGIFLGTAGACTAALLVAFLNADSPSRLWVLGGATLYLVGSFLVTMRFNVPRNDRLARVSVEAPQASAVWQDYLVTWTAWNHIRTGASVGASVLFVLACL